MRCIVAQVFITSICLACTAILAVDPAFVNLCTNVSTLSTDQLRNDLPVVYCGLVTITRTETCSVAVQESALWTRSLWTTSPAYSRIADDSRVFTEVYEVKDMRQSILPPGRVRHKHAPLPSLLRAIRRVPRLRYESRTAVVEACGPDSPARAWEEPHTFRWWVPSDWRGAEVALRYAGNETMKLNDVQVAGCDASGRRTGLNATREAKYVVVTLPHLHHFTSLVVVDPRIPAECTTHFRAHAEAHRRLWLTLLLDRIATLVVLLYVLYLCVVASASHWGEPLDDDEEEMEDASVTLAVPVIIVCLAMAVVVAPTTPFTFLAFPFFTVVAVGVPIWFEGRYVSAPIYSEVFVLFANGLIGYATDGVLVGLLWLVPPFVVVLSPIAFVSFVLAAIFLFVFLGMLAYHVHVSPLVYSIGDSFSQ